MQDEPNIFSSGSQIVGVGIDIVDVARIARLLRTSGKSFLERTFTQAEINYCQKFSDSAIHYAARFAAKEAMAKALSTGFSEGITLKSVSVENDPKTGAPLAVLDDAAKMRMRSLGAAKMLISLSHLKDYAQAIAILR